MYHEKIFNCIMKNNYPTRIETQTHAGNYYHNYLQQQQQPAHPPPQETTFGDVNFSHRHRCNATFQWMMNEADCVISIIEMDTDHYNCNIAAVDISYLPYKQRVVSKSPHEGRQGDCSNTPRRIRGLGKPDAGRLGEASSSQRGAITRPGPRVAELAN